MLWGTDTWLFVDFKSNLLPALFTCALFNCFLWVFFSCLLVLKSWLNFFLEKIQKIPKLPISLLVCSSKYIIIIYDYILIRLTKHIFIPESSQNRVHFLVILYFIHLWHSVWIRKRTEIVFNSLNFDLN